MWVAKERKLSSAFLHEVRRYVLPGCIIRYREHTTESSFRLKFKCCFLLFLFCFIQFYEQASYIYKSVSGKHCQWLRLSEWNGTSLRWCSLHKWIGKNWICTEQMVCMCWMRGHLKIILSKKPHWVVSKWTPLFLIGGCKLLSHLQSIRGVGHIVYINLHVSQRAFSKQLPVDDWLPSPWI